MSGKPKTPQVSKVTIEAKAFHDLQQAEAKYRSTFENAAEGIFQSTPGGRYLSVNPAMARIYGYETPEEMMEAIADIAHQIYADPEMRGEFSRRLKKEGKVERFELRNLRKDGSLIWTSTNARIVRDAKGKVLFYEGFVQEITERKLAEEQIAYQAQLLAIVNDAVVASDAQYRITAWNAAAESMYGWKAEEVLGRFGVDITRTKYTGVDKAEMLRAIAERGSWRGEATQARKYGTRIPVEISSMVLRDESGQITGYLSVNRDITERKQAEEALRHSREETSHVNRLLLALSQASNASQSAFTTEEVCRAIQDQLTQLGYYTTGFEFAQDGQSLAIAYLNYRPDLVRKGEKMAGISLRDFRFHPRADSIFHRVITKDETVFIEDTAQAVADVLPKKLRALARPMTDLFKLNQSIFAPMKVGDETIGILSITGPDLTEADNPAVTVFAHQAAIAMQNAKVFHSLDESRARLAHLSRRLVEVQEEERRRIARELHDNVGQSLTALTISLEGVSHLVKQDAPRSKIAEIQELTKNLIAEVNALSVELRPRVLDDLGLIPGLLSLFSRFSTQTGVEIDFKHTGIKRKRVTPEIEISAYRIIQEALTNVVRHAGVKTASVRLQVEADMLWIQVQDEGKGFDLQQAMKAEDSMGLLSMTERAGQVGGRLEVETAPAEGTLITCQLPLGGVT
jgi:PAS domain S-box-containing protein